MDAPQTQYAESPDGLIAWQTLGEGPLDLLYLGGQITHLDLSWDIPEVERFRLRLSQFSRLILFDRLGTGISDPAPAGREHSVEQWMQDMDVVLAAAGSRCPVVCAEPDAGPAALQWAAARPERTRSLILLNPCARFTWAEDHPIGVPQVALDQLCDAIRSFWGSEQLVKLTVPSRASEPAFMRVASRFQRASATPRAAAEHYRHHLAADVRALLPQVRCPTLLLHRPKLAFFDSGAHARFVESKIEGSRRVEVGGGGILFALEQSGEALGAIEEFLTGRRELADADRSLLTVLFVDVVGSTRLAASLGDEAWRDVAARFQAGLRTRVQRFRGRVVDTAGDGLFAVFESPTRALRCADALRDEARAMNLPVRIGLHAGECESAADSVRGLVVHIGARVAAEAKPDEIWVTSTLAELVVGSDFRFAKRGTYRLKGVEGARRLFALATPEPGEEDDD